MSISPQPPVPAKPTRTLRKVLIIVGVVLVLCCGGAATGGFLLFRTAQEASAPARAAADQFITALETDDHDAAYGRLCARTQSRFTRDAFRQGISQQPNLRSHKIVGVSVSNYNGRVSGTVTAELTLDSGFVDRHEFALVKEDGRWKVCGEPY